MARSRPLKPRLKSPYHNRVMSVELAFELLYPLKVPLRKKEVWLPNGLPVYGDKAKEIMENDKWVSASPIMQNKLLVLYVQAKRRFVRKYEFRTLDELISWGQQERSTKRKRGQPKSLSSTKPQIIETYCEMLNRKLFDCIIYERNDANAGSQSSFIFTTDLTSNVYRVPIGRLNDPNLPNKYYPHAKVYYPYADPMGWTQNDFSIKVKYSLLDSKWVGGDLNWFRKVGTQVLLTMPYHNEIFKARSQVKSMGRNRATNKKLKQNTWYYADEIPLSHWEIKAKKQNQNVGLGLKELADNDRKELASISIGSWEARNKTMVLIPKRNNPPKDYGIINTSLVSVERYSHNPTPYWESNDWYEWIE